VADIDVTATWDDEAQVWVATSEQVPGLVTEAATIEALLHKLATLVPELLTLNTGAVPDGLIPVNLKAERRVHYAV